MEKSELESVLNLKIKDLKVSPGAVAGAGVAGTLLAFEVTTVRDEKLHLVHKAMGQQNPMQKEFTIKNQSFLSEISFYTKLVPALEAFARKKDFPHLPVIQIPKYYGGVVNNDTDYLLMEDLRADGFQMCDKYAGFTFEEASWVLKDVAKFHAVTYAWLKWEGDKILAHPDFKVFAKTIFDDPEFRVEGTNIFNSAFEIGTDLVAARNPELGEKMKNFDATMRTLEQMHETTFKTDKDFFSVLILGDLWLNNILVKRDKSGKLQQIKFIDFQLTRRGNIFEELQYFIFTSTTPVFRASHLTHVLEAYYESFAKTLKQLHCPLPVGFTKGFLLDNFQKCYRPAFKYMTFAIPLQLADPEAIMKAGAQGYDENGQAPEIPQGPPPGAMPSAQMQIDPAQMFVEGIKFSMGACPKALDRLYDITVEMSQLNII